MRSSAAAETSRRSASAPRLLDPAREAHDQVHKVDLFPDHALRPAHEDLRRHDDDYPPRADLLLRDEVEPFLPPRRPLHDPPPGPLEARQRHVAAHDHPIDAAMDLARPGQTELPGRRTRRGLRAELDGEPEALHQLTPGVRLQRRRGREVDDALAALQVPVDQPQLFL